MLIASTGCSTEVTAAGGAGGGTGSTTGSKIDNSTISSGVGANSCIKPTSFPMTVTLPDGTKIPGSDAGVPASTTVAGTLHLVSADSYSVEAPGGDTILVQHDGPLLAKLGLVEGASVSLFVGYAIDPAFAVAYRLQVELSSASGDLLYFGAGGELDIPTPASRVAIDFGAISCTNAMGSGTGGAASLAVHDVDVKIDGATLGSFPMGTPATKSVGGKSFEVDDRDSMENFYGGGKPLAVLGRAVP